MAGKPNGDIIPKEIREAFALSAADIQKLIRSFQADLKNGLEGNKSSLKLLPAYIDCPTGAEKGSYLALDIGGTNFRIFQVLLNGKGKVTIEHTVSVEIPGAVMTGDGKELFDFFAQRILEFVDDLKLDQTKNKIPLGLTFSFPVDQELINCGKLIEWTKGFSATGVKGRDVVQLLTNALLRNNVDNIEVCALINDTVGTLLAKSYEAPDCDVGVIFGTGTNGCYRESISALGVNPLMSKTGYMVVNTEWGNFNKLPVNKFDRELDKKTINPSRQQLEKMISGLYLGEVARLTINDLIRQKIILPEQGAGLGEKTLTTREMAKFEQDRSVELDSIRKYLEIREIERSTVQERRIIKEICRLVARRAARISAAAISAVVTWMDPGLTRSHVVAIDGSLYKKYPGFRQDVQKTMEELYGKQGKMILLSQVKDGSGVGGAVAAALAK